MRLAVYIGDECVKRAHPLDKARFERPPGFRVDNPRNRIERKYPLGTLGLSVDVEGDAHPQEHPLGLRAQGSELGAVHFEQARRDRRAPRMRSRRSGEHLIEHSGGRLVCRENRRMHARLRGIYRYSQDNLLGRFSPHCPSGRIGRALGAIDVPRQPYQRTAAVRAVPRTRTLRAGRRAVGQPWQKKGDRYARCMREDPLSRVRG